MRRGMRVVGVVAAAFGIAAASALGWAAWTLRSLETVEGKAWLLARASAALGTDVRARQLDVSMTRGLALEGIEIANPPGFAGPLLTADALVLRHRLLPLFQGRVEVERLSVQKPHLALHLDAKGSFNCERLGRAGSPGPAAKEPARPAAAGAPPTPPLRVALRRLSIEDATVTASDSAQASLFRLEGGAMQSAIEGRGTSWAGSGRARVATLRLMDLLVLRGLEAPLHLAGGELSLSPLRGTLARGALSGGLTVRFRDRFRYALSVDLSSASAETLLTEAGFTGTLRGRLSAKATFEGTGGMPTLSGGGRADVADCRIVGSQVLDGIALALRTPELARGDFETCVVEFKVGRGRVETPVLAFEGAALTLNGRGRVVVETGALDYDLSLALARPVFAKLTAREIRGAFRDRGDGFHAVDFKVTGTLEAPRNDLLLRLGAGAARDALSRGLGRLFGDRRAKDP